MVIFSLVTQNMLNIRNIFSEVCDDCISIILDYIDTPHDILKLIYYNKHYLYCTSNNNNVKNKTTDSVQLLLFKKFYEKVMQNMSNYTQKHDVKWKDIAELLNDTTVISGGSLLQSIYGDVGQVTNIDISFYYSEYLNIYGSMSDTEKLYKLSGYISPSITETITITDIDIFTVTDKKIFGVDNIIEYNKVMHHQYHKNEVEILYMMNGNAIIIFNIYAEQKYAGVDTGTEILSNLQTDPTSWSCEKILNVVYNKKTYVYATVHTTNKKRFFRIPNDESFSNIDLQSDSILEYLSESNNCEKFETVENPAENLHIITSNKNEDIQKYLLKNGDFLLTSINNKFDAHKNYAKYTSYDSLEKKYNNMRLNSLYDPYRQMEKDIMIDAKDEEYRNSVTFSSENNEKKMVPLTYNVNDLLLNLIYLDFGKYENPHDFIEHDFDMDICRQSFNGKKITLYAMKNLINKKFQYNIDHIINNKMVCKDRKDRKYVCFRKRLQKYKARGFECINEKCTIDKVKELLDIKNNSADIETLKKIANRLNFFEEEKANIHAYLDSL